MKMNKQELLQLLKDPNIEGLFVNNGKSYIDRRYTSSAVIRLGLSPRNADLNIIGDEIVQVPEELISSVTEGEV